MQAKKSIKNKKVIIKLLLFSLLIGIFAFIPNVSVQADELADIEAEIDELSLSQSELAAKKEQCELDLADLESRKGDSENNLSWLNSRSEEQQNAYETLKYRQDNILDMQKTSLANLEQAKENFQVKLDQYGDRIETMFGMQQKSILELLLEADSLEGFFTSVKFMRIITDDDEAALDDLIEEQQKLVDLTESTQENIEANEEELNEIQSYLDSIEEDINFEVDQISYLNTSISDVNEEIDTYAAMKGEVDAIMAEAQITADAVRAQMEAEAEAEKQRQAEAEAEQQRQAEAAAKAEDEIQTNTSQTNNDNTVDQSPSTDQPEQSAPTVSSPVYTGGGFAWPVPGYYSISSYYGPRSFIMNGAPYSDFHTGVDIPAPTGPAFVAPTSGIISYVGAISVGGNAVIIDIGNGISVLGCHLSGFNCSVGQVVNAGDVVGFVGSTGFSTGAHLHFEIQVNGSSVDPLGYL